MIGPAVEVGEVTVSTWGLRRPRSTGAALTSRRGALAALSLLFQRPPASHNTHLRVAIPSLSVRVPPISWSRMAVVRRGEGASSRDAARGGARAHLRPSDRHRASPGWLADFDGSHTNDYDDDGTWKRQSADAIQVGIGD